MAFFRGNGCGDDVCNEEISDSFGVVIMISFMMDRSVTKWFLGFMQLKFQHEKSQNKRKWLK